MFNILQHIKHVLLHNHVVLLLVVNLMILVSCNNINDLVNNFRRVKIDVPDVPSLRKIFSPTAVDFLALQNIS